MHSSKKFFLLFFFLIASNVLADNTPVLQRTGQTFDPAIPTIQSVLGYDFGERITSHREMEVYLNALVQSSPSRTKLEKIGETWRGRALYYFILSSPENMARLEELRQANLKLADPRKTESNEAEAIITKNPVFVGLTYSVHGNEHSGVEAGLAMAYYLLASKDPETTEILKNCVILIDPMQNPDGRERWINYFYSMSALKPNPDRNAAEHNEVWPSGRYNFYLFDMNRDWTVLSQKETMAREKAYQQYQPQLYMDIHEMGSNSTYFFPPPQEPYNPNLPPSLANWWNILGKAISSEFDRYQVEYYVKENYDFWYPGYGDSWPTYNGALGGTFEQGSVRGLVVKRDDEVTVNYQDAIWHHFLSSRATCKMASARREEKLRDFYAFRSSAIQEGKTGTIKEFILSRAADPTRADQIVSRLIWQGVEVKQAEADFKNVVHGYMNDQSETRNFQKGDYIISLDQPLKRLILNVFEKEVPFSTSFLEAEQKRREDEEPSELYDITAWALPLAQYTDTYWTGTTSNANAALVQSVPPIQPSVQSATYAYFIDYNSNQAIAAAIELLQRNVKIYSSEKPFTANNKKYRAGSFIVKVSNNPSDLQAILADVAKKTGVSMEPTSTGWTEEGPDVGSSDVSFVVTPKVAVLNNMGTDPTSFGAILYMLEQRYHLPFTAIQTFYFTDTDINSYNVIILPDGGRGSYKQMLGTDGISKLKAWVESGGTLIALQAAAAFVIDNGELTSVKRITEFIKDTADPAPEKEKDSPPSGKSDEKPTESPDTVPGSIARAVLYPKSFLNYGYSVTEIPVFVASSNVFEAPDDMKPAVSYAEMDRLKISGLFWEIVKERLAKKAYATEESVGKGHVILFAEDPTFRAYWENLDRLFMNGILFGPSL